MNANRPQRMVAKLDDGRARPEKDAEATVLLISVLVIAVCIAADILIRIPQVLDSVVSPSLASQALLVPAEPASTFHEAYPARFSTNAGEWPTF